MIRPATASLASRTLRPSTSVATPAAQRPSLKSPASPVARPADRFDSGTARTGDSRSSGLVAKDSPLSRTREQLRDFHLTAQQKLDFLQKFGAPRRENFPPSLSGTRQYEEAQQHYQREVRQAEAGVKYEELKKQGGPRRDDYPSTINGAFEYEKARRDYYKQLQDLAVQAGYIRT